MKKQSTRFDRIISRIKNNPVAASVIVLGTIVIALATFTDAAKNLLSLIKEDQPEEARIELGQLSLEYTPDAFVEATKKDDMHAVKLFLTAGMDPNAKDKRGNTALMYAAREGDTQIINALLKANANINEENWAGGTALSWAVGGGNESILRVLLEKGATTEAINKAFTVAAIGGHLEILRILLDSGAEVDKVGTKALQGAAGSFTKGVSDKGQSEIVDFLLKQGVDVNVKNKDGVAPLHLATLRGFAAVARNLLNAGAEVDEKCECRFILEGGWTALLLALHGEHHEVVKVLLAKGADVNAKENRGRTALIVAVDRFDEPEIIQALLDAGAVVDEKDNEGHTALYFAEREEHTEIVQLLQHAKARTVKATKPR